ncbi:MAG: AAA family ATPase [Candidatus Krumholzibacteriia bacterium]
MSEEGLPVCRVGELEEAQEKPGWLVEGLWSRTAVGFVGGVPKLGKTWLGLDLALSVATGTPCLDRFRVPEPGDVLVYLAEDHPALVRERLDGLCRHRGVELERVGVHVITAASLRLDLERDRLRLTETVRRIRPRLLLLDPLVRLHRRDENHAGDVAELLAFLRELQREHNLAIVVVHHMRKGGSGRDGQALRGSGDFHAWTDSALYLTARRDRLLLAVEHRGAPAPEPIELRLNSRPDGSRTHLEVVATRSRMGQPQPGVSLSARIVEVMTSTPRSLTRVDLRKRLRVNNKRLGEALDALRERGVVVRSQQGWSLGAEEEPIDEVKP